MFFDVLGIEEKLFDKNATMSVYWRFFDGRFEFAESLGSRTLRC
jgi:hypothetical protein